MIFLNFVKCVIRKIFTKNYNRVLISKAKQSDTPDSILIPLTKSYIGPGKIGDKKATKSINCKA